MVTVAPETVRSLTLIEIIVVVTVFVEAVCGTYDTLTAVDTP